MGDHEFFPIPLPPGEEWSFDVNGVKFRYVTQQGPGGITYVKCEPFPSMNDETVRRAIETMGVFKKVMDFQVNALSFSQFAVEQSKFNTTQNAMLLAENQKLRDEVRQMAGQFDLSRADALVRWRQQEQAQIELNNSLRLKIEAFDQSLMEVVEIKQSLLSYQERNELYMQEKFQAQAHLFQHMLNANKAEYENSIISFRNEAYQHLASEKTAFWNEVNTRLTVEKQEFVHSMNNQLERKLSEQRAYFTEVLNAQNAMNTEVFNAQNATNQQQLAQAKLESDKRLDTILALINSRR